MRIAIVGAPGTGAEQLLQDLPAALSQAALPTNCALSVPAAHDLTVFDFTLLCGLDATNAAPAERDCDARLRQALEAQGRPFAVVYGDAARRVQCAVREMLRRRL